MPPENNGTVPDSFAIKEAPDGRTYIEQDNPKDVYAGKMKTNPTTGTESFEEWPMAKPDEEPDPLLDLEQAWVHVMSDTPLPSKQEFDEDVTAQNAAILVKELKYYIMASTSKSDSDSQHDDDAVADDEAHTIYDVKSSSDSIKYNANTRKLNEDECDVLPKSVYGASILLKLQCEDKSVQKMVTKMSYSELALFISDVYINLESAFQENERIAQVVIDTFAYEMTALILARYLDGMETCTDTLEECCFGLLKLCAERANAKEMHLSFKSFVSKIDAVYTEATAYLILQPLVELWGTAIVRIPRKRRVFVQDLVRMYDRLYPSAESFEVTFVPENGFGTEAPGRLNRLQDTLLAFTDKLTAKQLEQREKEVGIRLKVDMLGREKLGSTEASKDSVTSGAESGKELSEEVQAKKAAEKDAFDMAKDWVGERAVTLSTVLQMQTTFWRRLPPPVGEQRNVPKKVKKRRDVISNLSALSPVSDEEKEEALCKSMRLFINLGWTNPVVACQIARNGLNLTPMSRANELMREHIGTDIRSRKEKKSTLYSLSAVGHYLCASLRAGTIHRLNGGCGPVEDEYAVELSGSAFDFLEPEYAFDLVLPYLMAVIPQVVVSTSVAGIITLRAFLKRLPAECFKTISDILRLRCGTASMARDVSVLGVAHHLAKAVSMLDDPKHRRIAYETLQALLGKCSNALARYMITEYLFYDSTRVPVVAQLVTEMKDSLRFSDNVAVKNMQWTDEDAANLRQRFAMTCLPRFLMPKKDLLRDVNPIVTTVNALVYIAIRQKRALANCKEDELQRENIQQAMKFAAAYGRLGRECIRALASVAEHDRRNIPSSQLAKKSSADAKALFAASGKTLNQCVAALSSLELAMDSLTM